MAKYSQYYTISLRWIVVNVIELKPIGSGSDPDSVRKCFYLTAPITKNHERYLMRSLNSFKMRNLLCLYLEVSSEIVAFGDPP